MTFPYRQVLMIGASSGIGRGMAERLIELGSRVIVVGRRQQKLDEFISKYGEEKVTAIAFDISKRGEIPRFMEKVVAAHPDLDAVWMNAGIQNRFDFTKPEKLNLEAFLNEIDVNFSSFVGLTFAFLPFMMAKTSPASFIYTGSNIGIVPAAALPAYSISKAALNNFVLCLREQLKLSGASLKIIEVSPPPVQTELHDDEPGGAKLGMPLLDFVDQVFERLNAGSDQVVLGAPGREDIFNEIIDKRRAMVENLAARMHTGNLTGH